MKNFEQIRAKNALAKAQSIGKGKDGGDNVAKKVPVMILDNGILAAAAFALEKKKDNNGKDEEKNKSARKDNDEETNKGKGYADVFDAVIEHLADQEIALLDKTMLLDDKTKQLKGFIDHLAGVSSDELRRITAETMAYLNYLRRFVNPKK